MTVVAQQRWYFVSFKDRYPEAIRAVRGFASSFWKILRIEEDLKEIEDGEPRGVTFPTLKQVNQVV